MPKKPYQILVDVRVELSADANDWREIVRNLTPQAALKYGKITNILIYRGIREGLTPFSKMEKQEVGSNEQFLENGI